MQDRWEVSVRLRLFLFAAAWTLGASRGWTADSPTIEEVSAKTTAACDEIEAAWKASAGNKAQRNAIQNFRQMTWLSIAHAHAYRGEYDLTVAAFDRINSDHLVSVISMINMRTEITGEAPVLPDNLPPKIRELQLSTLADILRKRGAFEEALKFADQLTNSGVRAASRAEIFVDQARRFEKTDPQKSLEASLNALQETANVDDFRVDLKIRNDVCWQHVRRDIPALARMPIDMLAKNLVERSDKRPHEMIVKELIEIGEMYLHLQDETSAQKCFADAERLYGKLKSPRPWNESLASELVFWHQCKGLRASGKADKIPPILEKWEKSARNHKTEADDANGLPPLISEEILAGRYEQAEAIVKSVQPSKIVRPVVLYAKQLVIETGAPEHKIQFAKMIERLISSNENHPDLFLAPADLYSSADDQPALEQALADAEHRPNDETADFFRMHLSLWLAEHQRFAKSFEIGESIQTTPFRASVLAKLFEAMSAPK